MKFEKKFLENLYLYLYLFSNRKGAPEKPVNKGLLEN